jgi:hypothetical protein
MTTAILALQSMRRWDPVDAPIRSEPGARSRAQLALVLAQFCVETNPRYRPERLITGRLLTWCNIFVWDVTRALGCEVPHWLDYPRRELTANDQIAWLASADGFNAGWSACTPANAYELARQGCPVVATFKAPVGSGHVALVHPSPDDEPEILVTQAGRVCRDAARLVDCFGAMPVHFFSHP